MLCHLNFTILRADRLSKQPRQADDNQFGKKNEDGVQPLCDPPDRRGRWTLIFSKKIKACVIQLIASNQ